SGLLLRRHGRPRGYKRKNRQRLRWETHPRRQAVHHLTNERPRVVCSVRSRELLQVVLICRVSPVKSVDEMISNRCFDDRLSGEFDSEMVERANLNLAVAALKGSMVMLHYGIKLPPSDGGRLSLRLDLHETHVEEI